jgi:DNA-binding NarL/FixJ family response regulator/anti-sigma regulatory factor (Ser/Thr protein kinase)
MQVSKRILIVDRDPAIHALLDLMLKSGDRIIEDAYGRAEAMQALKTKPFSVVLADTYLSDSDGLAFLNQMRAEQPRANVIVMTDQPTPSALLHSISNQAFGYISKPFTATEMKDLVNSALESGMVADDITMLSGRPEWITLRIRCKIKVADRLTNFFREFLSDLSPDDRESISSAFRELLLNAIEHGGKSDPCETVLLNYIRTARCLIYMIRDPGEGFSFEKLTHSAVNNSDDSPFQHVNVRKEMGIRPGGFGILMTKNFADELLYNAKGNEVMFVKYLDH